MLSNSNNPIDGAACTLMCIELLCKVNLEHVKMELNCVFKKIRHASHL